MDHKYPITQNARQAYGQWKDLRRKLRHYNEESIYSTLTPTILYMNIVACILNLGAVAIDVPTGDFDGFTPVSIACMLVNLSMALWWRRRYHLYRLKRACDKLEEKGEIVEISDTVFELWKTQYREQGFSDTEGEALLLDTTALVEHLTAATRHLSQVRETLHDQPDYEARRKQVTKGLAVEINNILSPLRKVKDQVTEANRSDFRNELNTHYGSI